MKVRVLITIVSIGLLVMGLSAFILAADTPYHLIKEIKIGGEGGWDYLSVDSNPHRLFVSHGTQIEVIDLNKGMLAGRIADTPGVHGFAIAADLGKGFSTNGRENKAGIVDLKTLRTLSKVDTGANPDAVLYEPKRHEVYTFNGRGQDATVIDAKTGAVVATIPLGGKPETGVADTAAGRVYVNIEDKSTVAVIDSNAHKVLANWPIAPGETATGMAFDLRHHHLFIVCENKLMVIMDSTNGKVVQTLPIGAGVDGAAFDPATGYAFASAGRDGIVTIVKADKMGKYAVVQTLQTQRGARTITLDPETHNIYLSTVDYMPVPGSDRSTVAPGTFKVLVYGMNAAR